MLLGLTIGMGPPAAIPTASVVVGDASFGALTQVGAGGVPVTGTTILSGDPLGHWAITSGYIAPSSLGDTANLNAGPYSLTFNDGSTMLITIDANAYDVRTQAEWDATLSLSVATISGKTVYLRPDSYRGGGSIVTGVTGATTRLRRADYGGLVIRSRDPADPATVDKFIMRGVRNAAFRYLKTTRVAEVKFSLIGEASNVTDNIVIEWCDVSGAVADPNGDYAISTNYPNRNIDLISTQGSAANSVGNLTIRNNLVQWAGTGISLRVNITGSTCAVTGNRVRFFYDDGIGITHALDKDCPVVMEDNVVSEAIGISTDSDAPHVDALRLISSNTATANWTAKVNRNRTFPGNSRAKEHMQGFLASDFKKTGSDSGYFYVMEAIGNVIISGAPQCFSVENAKDGVFLNNTAVSYETTPGSSGIRIGFGSTDSTSSGTHRIERNIAESYNIGGTPAVQDNITLGNAGAIIPYGSAFDGVNWDVNSIAELMTVFSRKAGGPADLPGTFDAGAIGSGAVTWAASSPGSDGANIVS